MIPSRQAKLEDICYRARRLLQASPDSMHRLSIGALEYCLKGLLANWVKLQNFRQGTKNKFAYACVLAPRGITEQPALTGSIIKRKHTEYEAKKAEITLRTDTDRICASLLT